MAVARIDSVILVEKISQNLSELLSENTPVFIKSYGRGALATASFRGTDASHTQVTWNGISMNSPITGMVDFSLVPVYTIDDLELRSGAASLADRSGGLGGGINLTSRVDWRNKLGIKYIQGIGSYKTFNEYVHVSVGNPILQSKTRIYHQYSKNNYTFINRGIANTDPLTGEVTHPLDTNHNADYTIYGLLQELYFRPDEKNIISLRYWYQHADRTIPGATSYEGPDHSNLNRQGDDDHKVVADWNRYGKKGQWMVRSGFAAIRLLYTLKNQVPGLGQVPAVYSESSQASWYNAFSYRHEFSQDFSVEGKVNADWHWVESTDTVTGSGYRSDRSDLSLLLALRKSFFDRLNLNLMLRQDWTDFTVSPMIPYFGFDLSILKGQRFYLKGNISRNYHQPSLNDLYWQPGGNPELKPEKSLGYELGLEYEAELHSQDIGIRLTAFRSHVDDGIIWLPSFKGYWEPRNIEKVIASGVEIGLDISGGFGRFNYTVHGNYAYTSSVNKGDPEVWGDGSYNKQLPYIPLHSGNILVSLAYRGFYLSYQHNSYSERYTTTSNDITRRGSIYPYFMNDIALGKEFRAGDLSFSGEFKIYNLFNETYHTVLYRPMPGRNFMLVLMVKFEKR